MFKFLLRPFLTIAFLLSTGVTWAATSDMIKMKAFLCSQWECPATFMKAMGLSSIIGKHSSNQAFQSLVTARSDAHFFADRVTMAESGSHATDLYRRLVIKISAGDKITRLQRVETSAGPRLEEVPLSLKGLQVLDLKHGEGAYLKINGRALVSKELKAAHAATQSLIFEGIVKAPQNELKTATDVILINQRVLEIY